MLFSDSEVDSVIMNVCILLSVYWMDDGPLLMYLSLCVSQICFLVSAFRGRMFSEDSCATLGLFFHYFHLSQFSWMLIQVKLYFCHLLVWSVVQILALTMTKLKKINSVKFDLT